MELGGPRPGPSSQNFGVGGANVGQGGKSICMKYGHKSFNSLLGFDPRSSVDVMKSFGMDSSREERLQYARDHNIGGVPFSSAFGDAMREDILRCRSHH